MAGRCPHHRAEGLLRGRRRVDGVEVIPARRRALLPVPLGLPALHAAEALLDRDGGLALALVELRNTVRRRRVAGDAHDAAHGHGLVVGVLSLAGEHRHCCFCFERCATRLCRSVGLPKSCGIAAYTTGDHSAIFTFFEQIERARTKCTRLSTRRDDTMRYCRTLRARAKMLIARVVFAVAMSKSPAARH